MILSLSLTTALANAVQLEAARTGQSPAAWLLDRLHDRFGLTHTASASPVPLITDNDTDNDD